MTLELLLAHGNRSDLPGKDPSLYTSRGYKAWPAEG